MRCWGKSQTLKNRCQKRYKKRFPGAWAKNNVKKTLYVEDAFADQSQQKTKKRAYSKQLKINVPPRLNSKKALPKTLKNRCRKLQKQMPTNKRHTKKTLPDFVLLSRDMSIQ